MELAELEALRRLEGPRGSEREDYRAALIAYYAIASVAGEKDAGSIEDFLLRFKTDAVERTKSREDRQTSEEQKRIAREITEALGGMIVEK